jgi:hypothetical protein
LDTLVFWGNLMDVINHFDSVWGFLSLVLALILASVTMARRAKKRLDYDGKITELLTYSKGLEKGKELITGSHTHYELLPRRCG